MRNASLRWEERNNQTKKSEPAKHFFKKNHHAFSWVILCQPPQN